MKVLVAHYVTDKLEFTVLSVERVEIADDEICISYKDYIDGTGRSEIKNLKIKQNKDLYITILN